MIRLMEAILIMTVSIFASNLVSIDKSIKKIKWPQIKELEK